MIITVHTYLISFQELLSRAQNWDTPRWGISRNTTTITTWTWKERLLDLTIWSSAHCWWKQTCYSKPHLHWDDELQKARTPSRRPQKVHGQWERGCHLCLIWVGVMLFALLYVYPDSFTSFFFQICSPSLWHAGEKEEAVAQCFQEV